MIGGTSDITWRLSMLSVHLRQVFQYFLRLRPRVQSDSDVRRESLSFRRLTREKRPISKSLVVDVDVSISLEKRRPIALGLLTEFCNSIWQDRNTHACSHFYSRTPMQLVIFSVKQQTHSKLDVAISRKKIRLLEEVYSGVYCSKHCPRVNS